MKSTTGITGRESTITENTGTKQITGVNETTEMKEIIGMKETMRPTVRILRTGSIAEIILISKTETAATAVRRCIRSMTGTDGVSTVWSGMAVTILEGSDQSLVNYYARDGRKLDISVTIPEESAGYPLAMAISPDGTKLAVSCYVIQGAAASCLLTVYNFDADSAQTDHVEGSIDYADTDSFVPLLFFLTDEKLVTAADNRLDLITVQGGLSDRRTDLTGEVRRVFYGKDRIGLLVQDENGQHIDLYDDQCVFLRSLQEEETFDSYSFAGGDILMVSEDSIRIRSSSGLVRYAQQFRNPITDVVWAGESGRLYLAGENSLQSISLR